MGKHRNQANFPDLSSSLGYEGKGHALAKGLGTCKRVSLIRPNE